MSRTRSGFHDAAEAALAYGVAHLVLGGVASRLDLTVEHLEELELALDGLLDRRDGGEEVTLTLRVLDGGLAADPRAVQSTVADFDAEPGDVHSRSGGSSTQWSTAGCSRNGTAWTWTSWKQTGTDGPG